MKALKSILILFALLILVSPPYGAAGAETTTIRDMAGRSVQVPVKPERIICLGPGTLRLITYLGVQNKVAGVEGFEKMQVSGRPYWLANPALARLPVVGPGGPGAVNKDPDLEAVLTVKPQVIFITDMEPAKADNLQRKLEIPVILLSYGRLGGFDEVVYDSLRLAAKVMGAEKRGEEVVSYLERCRRELKERASKVPEGRRPLAYVGALGFKGFQGIESTDANYIPFEWTSARNGAKRLGGREHFFADRERLLPLDPDVMFIDAGSLSLVIQDYAKKPDFYRAFKAFRTGRVYVLYPYNYYTTNIECALIDSYAVGKILYPEAFADVNVAKKADDIFRFFVGASVNDRMGKDFGVLGRQLTLPASHR